MPKQLAFWVIMLLWPIVHFLIYRVEPGGVTRSGVTVAAIIWVLLFLLGWQVFGFVIQ
jgi:hypothetical protein